MFPLASRPLAAGPAVPRAFLAAAVDGEFGWAAWVFSRQAKLNAWGWHGLGSMNVYGWAPLGPALYLRTDGDDVIRIMQPDVFASSGTAAESESVLAVTQWLDFGKPGKRKALTGIDVDGENIDSIEIYTSAGGSRTGELAETVAIGSNQDGWTYSGELIPLSCDGTEFMLRFIGTLGNEVRVSRLTLQYDLIEG